VTRFLPPLAPKTQCRIVQPAPGLKNGVQGAHLFRCRVEAVLVRAKHLAPFLFLDIPLNRLCRNVPGRTNVIASRPKAWQPTLKPGEFFTQDVGGVTFQSVHNLIGRNRRRKTTEQVDVIGLDDKINDFALELRCLFKNKLREPFGNFFTKRGASILRTPYEVIVDVVGCVSGTFYPHRTIVLYCLQKVKFTGELRSFPIPAKSGEYPERKNLW
jgi:hypothetical protein